MRARGRCRPLCCARLGTAAAGGPGPAERPAVQRLAAGEGPFPGAPMLCLSVTPPVARFRHRAGRLCPGRPRNPLPRPRRGGERRWGGGVGPRGGARGSGARQRQRPMRSWSLGAAPAEPLKAGPAGGAGLRASGAGERGVCRCCCPRPPAAAPPSRPAAEPHSTAERWEGVAGEREEEQRRSSQPAAPRRTAPGSVRSSGAPRVACPAGGERSRAEQSPCAGGHGGPAAGAPGARAAAAAVAAPGKERRPPPRPCPAGVRVPSLPGRAREHSRERGAVRADPSSFLSGAFAREARLLRAPRGDGGLGRVEKRRGGAGSPFHSGPRPRPGRSHPAPAGTVRRQGPLALVHRLYK